MRRFAIAALAGASVLAVPVVATASHSNGASPQEDFVVGSIRGQAVTPAGTFDSIQQVNARAVGAEVPGLGAPAEGWFRVRIAIPTAPGGEFEIRGRVLCINSVGNSSVTRGLITESNSPLVVPVGLGTIHRHVDNGEGEGGPPDEFGGMVTGPPSGEADCPHVPLSTLPVAQGNFVVHDASS